MIKTFVVSSPVWIIHSYLHKNYVARKDVIGKKQHVVPIKMTQRLEILELYRRYFTIYRKMTEGADV